MMSSSATAQLPWSALRQLGGEWYVWQGSVARSGDRSRILSARLVFPMAVFLMCSGVTSYSYGSRRCMSANGDGGVAARAREASSADDV